MTNQPVTKQDLQDLKTEIVDEISGVLADAMTNIGENFQEFKGDFQELKAEVKDVKTTVNRIEQKLDPTIERVDELALDVANIKARAASSSN